MATIPTVDLSPFFNSGDEDGKKKAMKTITEACSEYGFFQIVNHGVPVELTSRAMQLSKEFFAFSDEEKVKCSPGTNAPLPAGYSKQPGHSLDKNEYLLLFPPHSGFNILPANPPDFREVLEKMFSYFQKTGALIETIFNDCLELPPNFLKEYNSDRSWDFLVALRYYLATESENNGLTEHEDGNCVTFVIQDEVGGLEVKKDGKWIPVVPAEGTIVVNVADVIQVLSNKKFRSATHRVVRPSKDKNRHSFAFFYNIQGDKWIEPLPCFTKEIRVDPKYKGFFYKDYQAMRLRNKTHPPSDPEQAITINHYEI